MRSVSWLNYALVNFLEEFYLFLNRTQRSEAGDIIKSIVNESLADVFVLFVRVFFCGDVISDLPQNRDKFINSFWEQTSQIEIIEIVFHVSLYIGTASRVFHYMGKSFIEDSVK